MPLFEGMRTCLHTNNYSHYSCNCLESAVRSCCSLTSCNRLFCAGSTRIVWSKWLETAVQSSLGGTRVFRAIDNFLSKQNVVTRQRLATHIVIIVFYEYQCSAIDFMASPALSYIPGQQHLVAAPDAGWNPRSGAGVQFAVISGVQAMLRCSVCTAGAGGVDGLLEVGGPAWRAESQCRSQWGAVAAAAIADMMIIWPYLAHDMGDMLHTQKCRFTAFAVCHI